MKSEILKKSIGKSIRYVIRHKLIAAAVIIVIAITLALYEKNKGVANTGPMLKAIAAYKVKNGNYGTIPSFSQSYNCFTGNTFIKDKAFQDALLSIKMDDMYCRFKVNEASKVLESWSISISSESKVYCLDSQGNDVETPGLTMTANCKGE